MGKPYSDDLRERVVEAIAVGRTREEAAELHRVSLSTVGRLIRRKRETGSISPDKFGGYKQHALAPHTDRVRELVAAQPDGTLLEYQTSLAKFKVKVSQAGIFRFLRHLDLSYKKKVIHASEQDRPDVAAARQALREDQKTLDPKQLVFIDETSASTNMTRRYGRAPGGKRLVCKVPHGHWKTTTFIAALRLESVSAPLVMDGAMTGETFRAYIEQFLAPTLASGDIVLMDNVRFHKVAGIKEAIEARGASVRYLPAYSPDLNPIEQFFAKLKSILRKIGARTVTSLQKAIADCLKVVLPAECAAFLVNSGYSQPDRKTL
jgi:transposase